MKRLLLALLLLGGCAASPSAAVVGEPTQPTPMRATPPVASNAPVEPDPTSTPEPTPEPTPAGPAQFVPGDVIEVTQRDQPWASIIVSDVKTARRFEGGYFDDVPAKGNVYLSARITYEAITDGVDYNPFDWQVFVDDVAIQNYTFVSNGPTPPLSSGTLPKGRKATGFVVFELPAKGRVLLSYGANMFSNDPPVFEVVLREV